MPRHIISRTPVRISLFGGGTDYPIFYQEQPGAVMGTTINQYTYISVKTFDSSFFDHQIRIAYSKIELIKNIEEIQHPSVRECLKFMGIGGNLDIHIFSDLPARTGLGSSSSFTVGFLNALYALQGKKISKQKLAEEACHVEQNLIQENVGSQDQFHAAFGGFNVIQFHADYIQVRPLILSKEKKRMVEDHLLIFFTGMSRLASQIVKEQIDNTKNRINDSYLHKMLNMVDQAEEMILSLPLDQLPKYLGSLLHENWLLKKCLSSQITNPTVDGAYKLAMDQGAYGGKLLGAGSGGFLAFLAPKERHQAIREALCTLQEVTFRFENEGSTIVYMRDEE